MMWEAMSAISTLVGTIVVIIAAIFAYFQLKEMTNARWAEAVTKVFDMLVTNNEISEARRYIRNNDLPNPGNASPEVYEQMWKVWVSFDNLGVMIVFKMLPEHLPLEMFHSTVIECWEKLEPHIIHERRERAKKGQHLAEKDQQHLARYQVFFEDLYHRSLDYKNKYYPEGSQQFRNPNDIPIQLRKKVRNTP
jgi:hypothetical protein